MLHTPAFWGARREMLFKCCWGDLGRVCPIPQPSPGPLQGADAGGRAWVLLPTQKCPATHSPVPLRKNRVFLWSRRQAGPRALATHLGAFYALGKRWGCKARSPSSQHVAGGAPYILGRSQLCKHHAAPAGFPS